MSEYQAESAQKTQFNADELSSRLKKTIGSFEDQVMKSTMLSSDEKESVFALTTVNFMNVENIVEVAGAVSTQRKLASPNGRMCWICNVFSSIVRIVVTIIISVGIGALAGVVGLLGGPELGAATVLIGGVVGAIVGIVNVVQNKCSCPSCIEDNGSLSCTIDSCDCW